MSPTREGDHRWSLLDHNQEEHHDRDRSPRPSATASTPRPCSPRWTRSRPSPRSPSSASGPATAGSAARTTASTIKDFYAACGEDTTRTEAFTLDAGEPAILLGTDTGPNPAEYLLHALAACVTTSLVFSAAARKVRLTSVESTLEGDLDVQGAMGINTEDYRNGFTADPDDHPDRR